MNDEKILSILRVINDETRLKIIKILAQRGTMCACKILDSLQITQGTLSHHMKVLGEVGIVRYTRDGKYCNYSLVKEPICELNKYLRQICENVSTETCESCHTDTTKK